MQPNILERYLPGIDKVHRRRAPKTVVLDIAGAAEMPVLGAAFLLAIGGDLRHSRNNTTRK
jgi:hypothetical protein